ncbi:hypothetical protein JOD82_002050 [Paenibacillus sp. 1182]|nr:hypothetical protein [Paenibacillus sp. 1182]
MEVTRMSNDGLTREIWSFSCESNTITDALEVRLSYYTRSKRPSKRHKFRTTTKYESFRSNAREDVPMPDGVKQEIVELIKSRIKLI